MHRLIPPNLGRAICGTLLLLTAAFLWAQVRASELEDRIAFNIPAQPLETALFELSKQSSYQILFSSSSLSKRSAPTISGTMQVKRALDLMLAGTDLGYRLSADRTITVGPGILPAKTSSLDGLGRAALVDAADVHLAQADSTQNLTAQTSNSADGPGSTSKDEDKGKLAEIVVTGSRLARGDAESAGVTVIAANDLEAQGFKNVFDALNQLPQNTGFTTGADFGNTFTPAANAISLRSLGPNHTLVLLDGRRMADYPIAYNGSVNFVNLANIPSVAIERIEVLSDGGSAIYGSDAVAGVVNVILKKHIDGVDFNVKAGTTDRGGGDNARLQLSGGKTFDRFSTVFAVELSKTNPIWSNDRNFMSSLTLDGSAPTSIWERQDLTTGNYIDPAGACSRLSGDYYNTVVLEKTSTGNFCASNKARLSYWTTQTSDRSENLYSSSTYTLNDSTSLFGTLLVGFNQVKNNTRGPTWTSLLATSGYFVNQNTGDYEEWSRRFSPEEIGGASSYDKKWDDTSANLTFGVKGELPRGWTYEAAYNGSVYESRNTVPHLLSSIDSYYLGPQLGVDPTGIPIYAPDAAKFGQPMTPAVFQTLVGHTESKDNSWLQTLSLTSNGKVVDLPAGPLQAAAVVEWGSQGFSNTPDPLLTQPNIFYNITPEQKISGSRSRYAAATEFNVPILEKLTATAAARFDDYSFAGRNNSKPTYDFKLEYRPVQSLLIRGNYATSFRAPDMNYIFSTNILGYEASTTDYYRCKIANQPIATCPYANVSPGSNYVQSGNKDLRFENGRSYGFGALWSPVSRFSISWDYWAIRIDDEVTTVDPDALLRIESDCRTGVLNPSSPQCVDAFSRIIRNPSNSPLNPGAINLLLISPINAAEESISGFDMGAKVKWQLGSKDNFVVTGNFTRVLSHHYQQSPRDPNEDLLHDLTVPSLQPDWVDKEVLTLEWSHTNWSSTIDAERYGKIPNSLLSGYLSPVALVNVSLSYRITDAAEVSLIGHNVFNTVPRDETTGWPFYPVGYYSPYGREGWLSFSYHFGS